MLESNETVDNLRGIRVGDKVVITVRNSLYCGRFLVVHSIIPDYHVGIHNRPYQLLIPETGGYTASFARDEIRKPK